jgi:hypothetical protein
MVAVILKLVHLDSKEQSNLQRDSTEYPGMKEDLVLRIETRSL